MDITVSTHNVLPFDLESNINIINRIDLNLTTLKYWNYTLYSNGTLSNGSLCVLASKNCIPFLLPNGTFFNHTDCWTPTNKIRERGSMGLALAVVFGISIIFTLVNMQKHRGRYSSTSTKIQAAAGRWQWNWMLIVAACAIISGVMDVDVDRYYVLELPIVISSIFYYLVLPSTLAVVWEYVRCWGGQQMRQSTETIPTTKSSKKEQLPSLSPFLFYGFLSFDIFLVCTRDWTPLEMQRDLDQQAMIALPMATDIRWKLGAWSLFLAWSTIAFSIWHTVHYYKLGNREGWFASIFKLLHYTPFYVLYLMFWAFIMVCYTFAWASNFYISPLKVEIRYNDIVYGGCNLVAVYFGSWYPVGMIICSQELHGLFTAADKQLCLPDGKNLGQFDGTATGSTSKQRIWPIHQSPTAMGNHPSKTQPKRKAEPGCLPQT